MRAFLVSSIGVTCAATVVLPLSLPTDTANRASAATAATASESVTPEPAAPGKTSRLPGSTQSLPLVPLSSPGDEVSLGLPAREVEPFALLGVVWNDPEEEVHGRIQVRTRSTDTGDWSPWQELQTHSHRPDSAADEGRGGGLRGGTSPLWVGGSDGVQVRVLPEKGDGPGTGAGLPEGLRVDLVDPGDAPSGAPADDLSALDLASSRANARLAPVGAHEIPALDREATQDDLLAVHGDGQKPERDAGEDTGPAGALAARARAPIGPRPGIVTRRGWGADERLRGPFLYTKTVKTAFIHHTAMSNGYSCGQAPSLIRGIYRYHVQSNGWRDVGYNFFVDKCGKIYEGRAGGVARPVMGAHTFGFNDNSTGIAVLGSYDSAKPSAAALDAVTGLVAWKLGLHGINPAGTVTVTSGGGKYAKGAKVRLRAVSGHRDGSATGCPGDRLYRELGNIRARAARLQGR
ncbi:MAG TPA: peptidoglycan recognition protein [Streptomyces sp.]|nr:peptidoglycan recognition protein [Streptomyces sp.]